MGATTYADLVRRAEKKLLDGWRWLGRNGHHDEASVMWRRLSRLRRRYAEPEPSTACPDCGGCGENSEAIRCGYCGGEGVIPGSDSEDDDSDEALAEDAHEARLECMWGGIEPFGEEP